MPEDGRGGGRIPDNVVDHRRRCCRDDLLVVDDMAVPHGREPFTGPRRIEVAMAEPSRR